MNQFEKTKNLENSFHKENLKRALLSSSYFNSDQKFMNKFIKFVPKLFILLTIVFLSLIGIGINSVNESTEDKLSILVKAEEVFLSRYSSEDKYFYRKAKITDKLGDLQEVTYEETWGKLSSPGQDYFRDIWSQENGYIQTELIMNLTSEGKRQLYSCGDQYCKNTVEKLESKFTIPDQLESVSEKCVYAYEVSFNDLNSQLDDCEEEILLRSIKGELIYSFWSTPVEQKDELFNFMKNSKKVEYLGTGEFNAHKVHIMSVNYNSIINKTEKLYIDSETFDIVGFESTYHDLNNLTALWELIEEQYSPKPLLDLSKLDRTFLESK